MKSNIKERKTSATRFWQGTGPSRLWGICFTFYIGLILAAQASAVITIADKGRSPYRIVLAVHAIPSERHAAYELQHYLEKISGAKIPIVSDAKKRLPLEILLGNSRQIATMGATVDLRKLGPDGFVLLTDGERLIIVGGRPRGTLNGVYALLEEKLGVRWFTPELEEVPKQKRVALPALNETQVPALENRDVYWSETMQNPDFAARHRLNGQHYGLKEKHGGPFTVYYPFVHTFDALVPRALYQDHPEYFPLIDGKRRDGDVQRCLTNPDVLKISIERVRQWIQQHPEATTISVSQNDIFNNCQCQKCQAIDDAEGSPAGSLLKFVNAVAEAIEPEFPKVRIETLAYLYTRKAPKTIRPRHNVIVRLCSYECCFAHPLETCGTEENRTFSEDLIAWGRIAPSLYVWDYTTNFAHYQQPFPNFDSLQANVRFFVKHGVKSLFEEGNYSSGGSGEMEPLRCYVLSKLLWNPDTDVQTHINEFVRAYYGNAGPKMLTYLNVIHRPVRENGQHIHILDEPSSAYLSAEVMDGAEKILNDAEKSAENDKIRFRVQVAQLPLWYVKIASGRVIGEARKDLVKRFLVIARKAGVSNLSESSTLDEWAKKLDAE